MIALRAERIFDGEQIVDEDLVLIEDGKVTQPIKGAMLIGNGPDAMHRVAMVGNDMKLDTGMGNCGKAGQWVPVGVGQPHLRMNQMTVGGTQV